MPKNEKKGKAQVDKVGLQIGEEQINSTEALAEHDNGITVDLMPFGEIAGVDDWVKVEGWGMTSIAVPGIAEAYEEAAELQTEEGQHWRV